MCSCGHDKKYHWGFFKKSPCRKPKCPCKDYDVAVVVNAQTNECLVSGSQFKAMIEDFFATTPKEELQRMADEAQAKPSIPIAT